MPAWAYFSTFFLVTVGRTRRARGSISSMRNDQLTMKHVTAVYRKIMKSWPVGIGRRSDPDWTVEGVGGCLYTCIGVKVKGVFAGCSRVRLCNGFRSVSLVLLCICVAIGYVIPLSWHSNSSITLWLTLSKQNCTTCEGWAPSSLPLLYESLISYLTVRIATSKNH